MVISLNIIALGDMGVGIKDNIQWQMELKN